MMELRASLGGLCTNCHDDVIGTVCLALQRVGGCLAHSAFGRRHRASSVVRGTRRSGDVHLVHAH